MLFEDLLRPKDILQKNYFTFFITLESISFSFILPAIPRNVHIVLSESGVIKIKQVPVGRASFLE